MSSIKPIKTGDDSWDIYASERDEFLLSFELGNFDSDKSDCVLTWETSAATGESEEYVAAFDFIAKEVLFERKIWTLKTQARVEDPGAIFCLEKAGYLAGREFGNGNKRARRFSCDRYDLMRKVAETEMAKYLDMNLWTFVWDSAKKRQGVCKYGPRQIGISKYFVQLHPFDEIHQVILHEVAHAIAGSGANHGPIWKSIATKIGYRHKKFTGELVGNLTAPLVGNCPNGHVIYRHRKPKTKLSCGVCSKQFDSRFLITWTKRS